MRREWIQGNGGPSLVISGRTLSTELLRSYGSQRGIRAAGRCSLPIAVNGPVLLAFGSSSLMKSEGLLIVAAW